MEPKVTDFSVLETIRPNIIRIRWTGDLTGEGITAWRDYHIAVREALGHDGPIFAFVEIGKNAGINKSARKGLLTAGQEQLWSKTALVGGRREVQVLAQLMITAIHLLVKDPADIKFVDSEEAALAWFDE